jgi:hypothetical protein
MLRLLSIITLLFVGASRLTAAERDPLLLRFRLELKPIGAPTTTALNADLLVFTDRLIVLSTTFADGSGHVARSVASPSAFRHFRETLAANQVASQRGVCGTAYMPIPPAYSGAGTISFIPRLRQPTSFAVGQDGAAPCSESINRILGAIFELAATAGQATHLPAP